MSSFIILFMSVPSETIKVLNRSSKELYRDCLRLSKHIAGNSRKGDQIRKIVASEFRKNAKVTDEDTISSLKANAVRGLSNYLMMEASRKDKRFQDVSTEFNSRESDSIKEPKTDS